MAKPRKWSPIDQAALEQLSRATTSPGLVYSLATNYLPQQLQQLPGAVSYFVSGHTIAHPPIGVVTPGVEIAVVRTDGDLSKAYNYLVGTSSNGSVYFTGPFKNFGDHHFASSKSVSIESLFGHWTNKVR